MDDLFTQQYNSTRSWFEYANGQTYNANGWAIAAAFAIFVYVMKDAKDPLRAHGRTSRSKGIDRISPS